MLNVATLRKGNNKMFDTDWIFILALIGGAVWVVYWLMTKDG